MFWGIIPVRFIHLEVLKLYSDSLPAMAHHLTRTNLPLTTLYMQMMTLAAFSTSPTALQAALEHSVQ